MARTWLPVFSDWDRRVRTLSCTDWHGLNNMNASVVQCGIASGDQDFFWFNGIYPSLHPSIRPSILPCTYMVWRNVSHWGHKPPAIPSETSSPNSTAQIQHMGMGQNLNEVLTCNCHIGCTWLCSLHNCVVFWQMFPAPFAWTAHFLDNKCVYMYIYSWRSSKTKTTLNTHHIKKTY